MAAEAVYKVKEAEEKGSEMIKNAMEQAKDIIRKAESDGVLKQKSIMNEANRMREEIIETATEKATLNCAALIQEGEREQEGILNPDSKKLEKAVEIAIERIVNVNGNS